MGVSVRKSSGCIWEMQVINHIYKGVYNSVVNYNAWKGFGLTIQIGYILGENNYISILKMKSRKLFYMVTSNVLYIQTNFKKDVSKYICLDWFWQTYQSSDYLHYEINDLVISASQQFKYLMQLFYLLWHMSKAKEMSQASCNSKYSWVATWVSGSRNRHRQWRQMFSPTFSLGLLIACREPVLSLGT